MGFKSFFSVFCASLLIFVNANSFYNDRNSVSIKPVEHWRFEDNYNDELYDINDEKFPVGRFNCSRWVFIFWNSISKSFV